MRTNTILLVITTFLLFNITLYAQPFTLDKNLKPTQLNLVDVKDVEGAKGIFASHILPEGSNEYYTISGFDELQILDVYIFSLEDNNQLKIDLVKTNWKQVEKSYKLQNANEGIVNFSFRSHKDFGLKITNASDEPISYAIAIAASPPMENYLKSPFIKATPQNSGISPSDEKNSSTDANNANKNGESSEQVIPSYILIILGVLVGIIIMLLLKNKISSKKSSTFFIVLFTVLFFSPIHAQQSRPTDPEIAGLQFLTEKDKVHLEEFIKIRVETRTADIVTSLKRMDKVASDIQKMLGKGIASYNIAKEFFASTETLGNCLSNGTPPGQPRIPSFCVEDDGECASCFSAARGKFNKTRYRFERLQNIYDCYSNYFDTAIKFGDDFSSYHGIAGLAWQTKKFELLKEIKKLDVAYDKKRVELLNDLQDSLIELDKCEQEHGLPDWFDRFGSIFLDFMENAYHR
ncbi:hypothetical protein [Yeosuana marina]|uniref:hypothetical protein n=1 Tax=Yeosuana marina TaxID=1565536 RepID=UPI0030C854F6